MYYQINHSSVILICFDEVDYPIQFFQVNLLFTQNIQFYAASIIYSSLIPYDFITNGHLGSNGTAGTGQHSQTAPPRPPTLECSSMVTSFLVFMAQDRISS